MFLRVFLDLDFLYNLGIMIITWIAIYHRFFYVVLMFDAVKRSKYLMNLLHSLCHNSPKIFSIFFLGAIILYVIIL